MMQKYAYGRISLCIALEKISGDAEREGGRYGEG
jgi:hypothetical protein